MKNLLLLCTKNVYFTFENNIYQQKDGVSMGYQFGAVLAVIFMVHLEKNTHVKTREIYETLEKICS